MDQVRATIGVIVGLTAAVFAIMCVDALFGLMHPFPEGLDYTDLEKMNAYMKTTPHSIFTVHIIGYAIAAAFAGFVTNKIAESTRYRPAIITGVGFAVMCLANMINLWHPTWVWIVSVPVYLAAAWFGGRFVGREQV